MLIPRVIPCLLIDHGAMVKTRRFKGRTYLGDPVNVINLFNRFEVDEIVLLDIGGSAGAGGPDLEMIAHVAEECWVPLTYGGGHPIAAGHRENYSGRSRKSRSWNGRRR
jgi:cyclase